jgi:MarR family transcriptional regulator, 2-MHQ and catechol-resistance regulon repressor
VQQEDLGMLITLSRRLVWNAAAKRLESNGYSVASWALAGYLMKAGPTTQRDISAAIGQHPAGVSRLIDELEAKGLVRRRRDASDRRRARVEVTRSGQAVVKAAHPHAMSAMKEALRALSAEEQDELRRLLRKLLSMEADADCEDVAVRFADANVKTARAKTASAKAGQAKTVQAKIARAKTARAKTGRAKTADRSRTA